MWIFWLFFLCFSASAWLPSFNNKADIRDLQWEQVKKMQYLYKGNYEQRSQAHHAKRALIRSGDISSLPAQRLLVEFLYDKLLQPEAGSLLKRQVRTSFWLRRTPLYKETQMDLWDMFKETEGPERIAAYKILRTIPLHLDMQVQLIRALYTSAWRKPARLILSDHELSPRSQDMLMTMLNSEDQAKVDTAERVLLRRDGSLTMSVQSTLIKEYLFDSVDPERRDRGRKILKGTNLGWKAKITLKQAISQASPALIQENQMFTQELWTNSPSSHFLSAIAERCLLAFKKL